MPDAPDEKLKEVTGILCGLLERDDLGPDEDFYEAGMTSVMILPLLAELEEVFNVVIPEEDFLDARTPHALRAPLPAARGLTNWHLAGHRRAGGIRSLLAPVSTP